MEGFEVSEEKGKCNSIIIVKFLNNKILLMYGA